MTADAGAGGDTGTNSPTGAPRLRGSLCDVDGWCWESPVPQGNRLIAVAAASPDEIWFGGSNGTLFRWTPSGFEGTIGELTRDEITALYARAPGDVWAATRSVVFHFDGARWATSLDLSSTSYPVLGQLAGSPDGALFAVGASVWLFDEARWRDTALPPAFGVQALWAASRSSAYASGSSAAGNQILHWDGTSWTVDFSGGGPLYGMWGSSANDIWAGGQGWRILHRDASGWSEVQPAVPDGEWSSSRLGSLFGSGADDVWAMGWRWSSTRASGCTEQKGFVQHWDGTRWSPVEIYWNWGDCWYNTDVLWAGASAGRRNDGNWPATVLHWDGAQSSSTSIQGDPGLAMFATSPLDVWAGGEDGNVFHFDGARWTDVSNRADPTMLVIGFWRDAGGAIHLAGANSHHPFVRWNGASWDATAAPAPVKFARSFWPAGDDDFWLIGDADQVPQQWRVYHVHGGHIEDAPMSGWGRIFGVGSDAWIYNSPGGLTLHRTFKTR